MRYTRRAVDTTLDRWLQGHAAIALEGAKGVGKTATASQRAATVVDLSMTERRAAAQANEDLLAALPGPVFVDEWQLVPSVWDSVRRAVDADWTPGRFILAGSASADPGVRIHSGAARIVSLRMRPMSIAERGLVSPTVSLRELLAGKARPVEGSSPLTLSDYTDEILASGFPGIRRLPDQDFRDDQLDTYIARIADHELPENGITVRRSSVLRSWLAAYAAATAGTASYSTILDAATPGEDSKPTRTTADTYRDHLSRIFILEPLQAWHPSFNPLKKLAAAPKHHLVDPALAARLVGVKKTALLMGDGSAPSAATGTWLGALFESLVVQSVRVYAEAQRASVSHLRVNNGRGPREVDVIVEGDDRRVVAIEIKLAGTVTDRDVRHLHWLHQQIRDRLADKIVINTGAHAYRRSDGVAVIPLALLGM
ncbi:MAG: DUF4143 domain-containing protein [Micrococcales bacterium]|nr:DUF4143 domain-containing protein [Micrococcales bacterium]